MRSGATLWAQVIIYKVVVQMVLLYGSKNWVVTGEMLKFLEGFHHWVSGRMMGNTDWCKMYGEWEIPPVADAIQIAGLWPIKE